jgi:hypothetical protein
MKHRNLTANVVSAGLVALGVAVAPNVVPAGAPVTVSEAPAFDAEGRIVDPGPPLMDKFLESARATPESIRVGEQKVNSLCTCAPQPSN